MTISASQPTNPPVGRSIVISPDDTSLSLAQAIYHHVTTKTERIFEPYPDSYKVSENEIYQLCHQLKQVAQRHHENEWSCVIDHALFQRTRTRHSSLEMFKASDKSQSDATSEVVITYDFLCANPFVPSQGTIDPERYKVVIRISQEAYLALHQSDGTQPSFFRRLAHIPSITVNIQYVDYTIARAILSAVREWVSSLESSKRSWLSRFTSRNEFALSEILPIVFSSSILIGIAGLAPNISEMSGRFLFLTLAMALVSYGAGYLVADGLTNSFYAIQPPTTIMLTRGDELNADKVKKKTSRAFTALSFLCISVFLVVILNVFSNFLYQRLFLS